MAGNNLYRERTTLRTVITMIGAIVAGGVSLYLATALSFLIRHPNIQILLRELGALLIASVGVALLWELASKRAFVAELMSRARMTEEVRSSGLARIVQDFNRDIDWPDLLKKVRRLDIFFAYGETWRNNNSPYLEELAQRSGVRVRVVLPDPNDGPLMAELGRRFRMTPTEVQDHVKKAEKHFVDLFGDSTKSKVDFSLWHMAESPVFSFYRFDDTAILALYKHAKGRGKIPTFVLADGGTLYEFVRNEFSEFVRDPGGLAKLIFPIRSQTNP